MHLEPFFDYIRNHIFLTESEEATLLAKLRVKKYRRGEFVVRNGETARYENFVLSGCLKTFYIDDKGQEHVSMLAIENWWACDLGSFLRQTPAHLNVRCLEDSELVQIHYNDLQQLYRDVPKFERFFRIIVQNAFVAAENRILNSFTLTATERYLQFREQYPTIEQRVPQYVLASYLGNHKGIFE
jgi:CRP-like cAMP-binding protein